MADPIIPNANTIVGKAIDAIVAARPETLPYFNSPTSKWSDLPAMWRAQMLLNLSRLADEAKAARLRGNSGEPLRQLCASEFNTALPEEPQTAYGSLLVSRPAPNVGHAPAGAIRKGDRFVKIAQPNGVPIGSTGPFGPYPIPVPAATYEAIQAVYLAQDQLTAIFTVKAVTPGADANIPLFLGYGIANLVQFASTPFDPTLACIASAAAGGSSGLTDAALIAAARSYAIGQFGPVEGTIISGVLREQSVRHYATFRATATVPYSSVYITDESWGFGLPWRDRVWQSFNRNWLGFGATVGFGYIANQQIGLAATITLRSSSNLNNTDEIDANVRVAARAYFDDRPDWYRWSASALQAVLSHADTRIQQCTSVTVTDVLTGNTLTPLPTPILGVNQTPYLTHMYLADNNVSVSYAPPS